MSTIVDAHAHTFKSHEFALKVIEIFNVKYSIDFENPGIGSIEDTLSSMKEHGIDYTLMANFANPRHLDSTNRCTISASKEHKNLVALVSFHPEVENLLSLAECYLNEGAKGIKLHPMAQDFDPRDERLYPVYEFAAEHSWPILFHAGRVSNARINDYADLDKILPVIEKFPEGRYILAHMADGKESDIRDIASRFPNVSFDTSIVISGYAPLLEKNEPSWRDDEQFIKVVRDLGSERFLFGSDSPWGHPGDDIKRFRKMALTDEERDNILGLNAMKLFNIE